MLLQIGNHSIIWDSKRQTIVCDSTTAAEIVAVNACLKNLRLLRNCVCELWRFVPPCVILEDNEATLVHLLSGGNASWKTKLLNVKAVLVSEAISRGECTARHISTHLQLADLMTKGLGHQILQRLMPGIGLHSLKTLSNVWFISILAQAF